MADDDRYITGGGEIDSERRSASYSTNSSAGPFSGGAILSGQEENPFIIGARLSARLPEGFSADFTRTAPVDHASRVADALRLAKQIEAGQLAFEARRSGDSPFSYGLQYGQQIGRTDGKPTYYPEPKGNWYVEAGMTPGTPERHVRGGARFKFAEGGFLSGPDYLSTGEAASPTSWGDPELASDFFKADRAARLAREVLAQEPARDVPLPPRRPPPVSEEAVAAAPLLARATLRVKEGEPAVPSVDEKFTARAMSGPELTERDRDLIIRTIAAETSGKSPEESQAIAHVILNRIQSGKFGASPEAVLFAKNQFEPWSNPKGANYPMRFAPTSARYGMGRTALEAALGGDDITRGALNFWGPKAQSALGRKPPKWAGEMPDYTDIGETRFHRPRAEGGEAEGYDKGGEVVRQALNAIRGWHGSGKQFKQFDASKMGSGAGELFGRGIYITDTPDFARTYRDMGIRKSSGQKIGGRPAAELYDLLQKQADSLPPEQAQPFYEKIKILEDLMFKGDPLAIRDVAKSGTYDPEAMQWFEGQVVPKLKTPGGLYEVEIKAKPEQFLQWQKPFGEQSPFIQDALLPKAIEIADKANQARAQMLERGVDYRRRPFTPERLEELRKISTPEDIGGLNLYGSIHRDFGTVNPNEWQPEANQFLRDKGVVGNAYKDKGGQGDIQNYVVYDPADTEILGRYAHGGEVEDALAVVRRHYATDGYVSSTQRLRDVIASIDPEASRDQPVMDPEKMGEAWDRARRNYQNFPVQEGEAVARPLDLSARDVIGGAIAGEARAPGADFRRGVADLLVGSKGLPDSGTLGFGVADAPMLTGIPLTLADMAHDVGQGDYGTAAASAALPAALYARGPLGAAGRRAVEIAKEYAKPAAATAAGVAGATLAPDEAEAAVPLSLAKKLITSRNLPKDERFMAAVKNMPGASIADEHLVLPVSRNQKPEQAGLPSVRGGVFYLPEGSANQRYYTGSGANPNYGGAQPAGGETAVANPLFVKGATGGKAPEEAYKYLMGKDAFNRMQNDVNLSLGSYFLPDKLKKELVQRFLDEHAPSLSDMSDYIFRNSSKGNQLKYALQEAAAGEAVRNAGHDAVLGYSTSRTKGPIFSEIFDVRERAYPKAGEDPELWPQFWLRQSRHLQESRADGGSIEDRALEISRKG